MDSANRSTARNNAISFLCLLFCYATYRATVIPSPFRSSNNIFIVAQYRFNFPFKVEAAYSLYMQAINSSLISNHSCIPLCRARSCGVISRYNKFDIISCTDSYSWSGAIKTVAGYRNLYTVLRGEQFLHPSPSSYRE